MKRFTLQALVAFMTVLLALPQGWCCLVPRMLPKAKDAEAACCCCHVQSEAPKPQEPKPAEPSDPFVCCCEPREATQDQGVSLDLAFLPIAFVPAIDLIPPVHPILTASRDRSSDSADPPLHVLHCVWLC